MEIERTTTPTVREELRGLLPDRSAQVAWLVCGAAFLWFYHSTLLHLMTAWLHQEDYQHGFFVPLFAIALLWIRRDMAHSFSRNGSLWALPFFAVWAAMRWAAIYFNYGTLPEISILPFFLGIALFVGGWPALRWTWPAIAFLFFMMPLPGAVQGMLSEQLQSIATRISVFAIQTLGIPSVAEGHVIRLTEKPLEVARACSGLRMMMLFFAICIGAAFLVRRPLWERALMVLSAPVIAVVANVIRIVVTAIAYEMAGWWPSMLGAEELETAHDWAGYLMMPVGLLLLVGEMSLISKLFVAPPDRPLVFSRTSADKDAGPGPQHALRKRRG